MTNIYKNIYLDMIKLIRKTKYLMNAFKPCLHVATRCILWLTDTAADLRRKLKLIIQKVSARPSRQARFMVQPRLNLPSAPKSVSKRIELRDE